MASKANDRKLEAKKFRDHEYGLADNKEGQYRSSFIIDQSDENNSRSSKDLNLKNTMGGQIKDYLNYAVK